MPKGRPRIPKKMWYVLSCDLGTDSRVKRDLRKAVKLKNLQKQMGRVVIVRRPQRVWINDKEVTQMRMAYPGYLLVHCRFTDDVFHLLGSVQGSNGLLMDPRNPIPLSSKEEAEIFIKREIMKEKPCQTEQTPVQFKWKAGDAVRVVNKGPWHGFNGTVFKIQNNRAVVNLQWMGREVTIAFMESDLVEDFAP